MSLNSHGKKRVSTLFGPPKQSLVPDWVHSQQSGELLDVVEVQVARELFKLVRVAIVVVFFLHALIYRS